MDEKGCLYVAEDTSEIEGLWMPLRAWMEGSPTNQFHIGPPNPPTMPERIADASIVLEQLRMEGVERIKYRMLQRGRKALGRSENQEQHWKGFVCIKQQQFMWTSNSNKIWRGVDWMRQQSPGFVMMGKIY